MEMCTTPKSIILDFGFPKLPRINRGEAVAILKDIVFGISKFQELESLTIRARAEQALNSASSNPENLEDGIIIFKTHGNLGLSSQLKEFRKREIYLPI